MNITLKLKKEQFKKKLGIKDGETPTKKSLLSLIKGALPKPKDIEPDTGEEIVKKINKLEIEEEKQIDWKHIKGLKQTIDDLASRLKTAETNRFAVGGMGTPLSQTFNCNGVLTAFTLNYDIGGEGKALWVYYQGQWLVPTTHFTISGRKIINTTFTPDDGTQIDVLYLKSE